MTTSPRSNKMKGIYLHFPFCIKKCSYCDFYSLPISSGKMIDDYVASLITEINLKSPEFIDAEIKTVYLGGGTPSLLGVRQFSSVMDAINQSFKLSSDVEITMETNPATINESKLKGFLDAGLNRISLGIQSFLPYELEILDRSHDVKQIYSTIDLIHKLEVPNFNLDLIYGIPNQTADQWLNNLKTAISLEPSHISMYLLQLESATPLGTKVLNQEVIMLEDEVEWTMYNEGCNYLEANQFKQYEISNFSKQNYKCEHNMVYWNANEYLGFGTGAVSFIGNQRCINKPQIVDYINCLATRQLPPSEILEEMNVKQLAEDAIILGLRLTEGININNINDNYNIDLLLDYKDPITDSIAKNLLKTENGFLKLTKKGYFLSNQVLCQFIGD